MTALPLEETSARIDRRETRTSTVHTAPSSTRRTDYLRGESWQLRDAIAISAKFGAFAGLNVNGTTINASGFLFHLANTSFANGAHPSFVRKPDGLAFGILSFGAALPDGSGQVTSAPSGFQKSFDPLNPATGLREINFRISLATAPDGLIFDSAAPSIPSVFTNPRTGTFDFFISAPPGFTLASLPAIPSDPGIDIKTQMAWLSSGAVRTVFPNPGEGLDPREQLEPVPEPSTLY